MFKSKRDPGSVVGALAIITAGVTALVLAVAELRGLIRALRNPRRG